MYLYSSMLNKEHTRNKEEIVYVCSILNREHTRNKEEIVYVCSMSNREHTRNKEEIVYVCSMLNREHTRNKEVYVCPGSSYTNSILSSLPPCPNTCNQYAYDQSIKGVSLP